MRIIEERLSAVEAAVHDPGAPGSALLGELLRPLPNGHRFERIGSQGDGGYVIPSDLPSPDGVVSIGVGPECSADEALAARGVPVWQFDHTVVSSPARHPGIRFHRVGLGVSPGASDGSTRPLIGLLELAGANASDALWLLLDAEGAEWDLLLDSTAPFGRFDLICIELHRLSWIARPGLDDLLLRAVEGLRRTHSPVAWSPNNFAPSVIVDDVVVPDVLEVTFVANRRIRHGADDPAVAVAGLLRRNDSSGPRSPEPFSRVDANPYGSTPRCIAQATTNILEA